MGFFNTYPYTDFHELNADWLLKEMQSLDARLDEALQTLSEQVYARVMSDIEPQLNSLRNDMRNLSQDFTTLRGQFTELDRAFEDFKTYVDGKLLDLQTYVDDSFVSANDYTNYRIELNNEYLLNQMTTYLSQIKVVNFFTGELVTIQSMFDYLSTLHLSDSIDYDTMATRNKTYTYLAGLNINYTDLVMHGNTLYV